MPVSALVKALAMNRSEAVHLIISKFLTSGQDFSNQSRQYGNHHALAIAAMCWRVEVVKFFLHEV